MTRPPQPPAVVFAGPNGSGKSNLTRKRMADPDLPFPANYINADDTALQLAAEIPDVAQGEAVMLPDEEAGAYEGPIRAAAAHHARQEVRQATLFRHDSLLLTAPAPCVTGAVRISYKDGYGTPTPLPAP